MQVYNDYEYSKVTNEFEADFIKKDMYNIRLRNYILE